MTSGVVAGPAAGAGPGLAMALAGPPMARAPAPVALQQTLVDLARAYPGEVGIAVMDLQDGWMAGARMHEVFPQQSVAKLWVAIAVLDAIDKGRLRYDTPVFVRPGDLSVFSQAIAQIVKPSGALVTVQDLLGRALIQSDNAADDVLIRLAGGVPSVEAVIAAKGMRGLTVGMDQRALQSRIAGLTWEARFAGEASEFATARARVPAGGTSFFSGTRSATYWMMAGPSVRISPPSSSSAGT